MYAGSKQGGRDGSAVALASDRRSNPEHTGSLQSTGPCPSPESVERPLDTCVVYTSPSRSGGVERTSSRMARPPLNLAYPHLLLYCAASVTVSFSTVPGAHCPQVSVQQCQRALLEHAPDKEAYAAKYHELKDRGYVHPSKFNECFRLRGSTGTRARRRDSTSVSE